MLCADKPVVGVRIVDTTMAPGVPLAGDVDVDITVDTHARQLVFCGEGEAVEQRVEVQNVSVMTSRPRWMLDLNWRRPAFPGVILIALCLWALPIPVGDSGFQVPTWLLKTSVWLALALPLLRDKRQLLAIELEADQVLIVETDDEGTALLLDI